MWFLVKNSVFTLFRSRYFRPFIGNSFITKLCFKIQLVTLYRCSMAFPTKSKQYKFVFCDKMKRHFRFNNNRSPSWASGHIGSISYIVANFASNYLIALCGSHVDSDFPLQLILYLECPLLSRLKGIAFCYLWPEPLL